MDNPAPHSGSVSHDADDSSELTVTVRVSGQDAERLRRAAAFQPRPIEAITAECAR